MRTKLTVLFGLLGLAGAASGCQVFASHEEVALWRATRLSTEPHQHLVALADYTTAYPTGVWAETANAERAENEDATWTSNRDTLEGLQFYLAAYPDGSHAGEAESRISALSTVTAHAEEADVHEAEAAAATAAEAAERRRLWVSSAMDFWTRTLLGIRNYGSPIATVARSNAAFSDAFGAAPEPVCGPTHCLKHYHSHFAIPNPGGNRIERDMDLFLRINLGDRGAVTRVEVLMPNKGFSRWYELENRTLIVDEDPEQRMAAIEWALARIEPVISEVARGARGVDVIPEPIPPLTASERAAAVDEGDAADEIAAEVEAAEADAHAGASGGTGAGSSALDELLAAAAGGEEYGTHSDEEVVEEVEEAVVFPIGLRAIEYRNIRLVLFAAGDEDYGTAFDGFYIELAN